MQRLVSDAPMGDPLTASSLKEQLDIFAAETLQRELERLQAIIVAVLAENKATIIKELTEHCQAGRSFLDDGQASRGFPVAAPPPPLLEPDGRRRRGFSRQLSGQSKQSRLSQASVASQVSKVSGVACERQSNAAPHTFDKLPLLDEHPVIGEETEEQQTHQHQQSWQTLGLQTVVCPTFERLSEFVNSTVFEVIAGSIVMLSVLWLTFQTHFNAVTWRKDSPREFIWVEALFCFLFVGEFGLRLLVAGFTEFFCGACSFTNMFDLFLVVLQLSDTVVEFAGIENKKTTVGSFVRVLRLFRIFRIARLFRFFPSLRVMLVSVVQSFQQLILIFAFIFFITGVFALIITAIVNEYKTQFTVGQFVKSEDLGDDLIMLTLRRNLQDFFGGVDKSILTLYGAISGGRDWHTSANPLMTFISPSLIYIFVIYTFFVVFAMMNIINSQFVDHALEASAKDRRESMVCNLMDTFSKSRGMVTEEDFMSHLGEESMKSFMKELYKREDVDPEEIKTSRLFEMLDDDGSGAITYDELVLGCIRLSGAATSLDLAVLKLDVEEIRKDIRWVLHRAGVPWLSEHASGA